MQPATELSLALRRRRLRALQLSRGRLHVGGRVPHGLLERRRVLLRGLELVGEVPYVVLASLRLHGPGPVALLLFGFQRRDHLRRIFAVNLRALQRSLRVRPSALQLAQLRHEPLRLGPELRSLALGRLRAGFGFLKASPRSLLLRRGDDVEPIVERYRELKTPPPPRHLLHDPHRSLDLANVVAPRHERVRRRLVPPSVHQLCHLRRLEVLGEFGFPRRSRRLNRLPPRREVRLALRRGGEPRGRLISRGLRLGAPSLEGLHASREVVGAATGFRRIRPRLPELLTHSLVLLRESFLLPSRGFSLVLDPLCGVRARSLCLDGRHLLSGA